MKKQLTSFVLIIFLALAITRLVTAADSQSGSITLAEAERQALSNDLDLKQSAQDVEIAKKELENVGKTLDISGNASANNTSTPSGNAATNTVGGTLTLNPQWSIYGNTTGGSDLVDKTNQFGISYSPFEFKQLIDTKQKEYDLSVKSAAYENAKIQLIVAVRQAYAEVIQKKKLLQLAVEISQLADEHLKRVQAMFEAGKIPRIDLSEADQRNQAARLKITSAQLASDSAMVTFNQLTGLTISQDIALNDSATIWAKAGEVNVEGTVSACSGNNPELQSADLLIETNQLLFKVADLQWAVGWNLVVGQEWKTYAGGAQAQTFSVTVKGSPLYSQSWKGKKEIAALNLEKSKSAKTNLLTKLAADLKNAWNDWRIAENDLTSKDEAVTLAKERLRLTNLKFENGMASAADVNKDRELLTQAGQDYWDEWLAMQNAREKFYRVAWGKPVFKVK